MEDRRLPFHDIAYPLVKSVLRSFAEFFDVDTRNPVDPMSVDDERINRHFAWLAYHNASEAGLRHLLDGTANEKLHPLRIRGLTERERLNRFPDLVSQLKNKDSVDLDYLGTEATQDNESYPKTVRGGPTRISQLIKQAVFETWAAKWPDTQSVVLPSPLSIIADFLTIPDFQGSRAYALVVLRSLMFETHNLVPTGLPESIYDEFSISELELAYGSINTSLRSRYRSKGQDKLPVPTGKQKSSRISRLLRDTLSMLGMLEMRFAAPLEKGGEQPTDFDAIKKALKTAEKSTLWDPDPLYEYSRPKALQTLPELSELVNHLFGLPLPIRGADTLLRGGLTFSSRGGLVTAIHGGPGSGKTSLTLGLCSHLAGLGITTLYLTAEESEDDLRARATGLVPEEIRRLPFYPANSEDWLVYQGVPLGADTEADENSEDKPLGKMTAIFGEIRDTLLEQSAGPPDGIPLPCSTVVVLDGLHEIATQSLMSKGGKKSEARREFNLFLETCRELKALVILTTGVDWEADKSLDYLVDVSLRLNHETHSDSGAKPHRLVTLAKARHQLCSPGTHGFQISGRKGVRFTPQMNYQLDTLSIWNAHLADKSRHKRLLLSAFREDDLKKFPDTDRARLPTDLAPYASEKRSVKLWRSSNIFINGEGSGGKAALALKMAIAPYFSEANQLASMPAEKVLVISFLYPEEYYKNVLDRLVNLADLENDDLPETYEPEMTVIHLYPGHLKPDVLFNRIFWTIRAAELAGDRFTSVVIDGIHNVFLQFPEIEKQTLFWPQLFNMLRTMDMSVIITHTMLSVREVIKGGHRSAAEVSYRFVDDNRSGPLRHALVNQTDFRIEVDPASEGGLAEEQHAFVVEVHSAIGQSLPSALDKLYWSRERLVFFEGLKQGRLAV